MPRVLQTAIWFRRAQWMMGECAKRYGETFSLTIAHEGTWVMLADPDAKVSTEYGSIKDYNGSKLAARNTFIINPKGEIAKVYTSVKPADHSEQVLKDLAELKKS